MTEKEEVGNVDVTAQSGGSINKSAQWKEVYTIKHFKAGDKTSVPKTLTVLENENGDIFLSARDENNRVMLRLEDGEVAQLATILQGRLLKKVLMK